MAELSTTTVVLTKVAVMFLEALATKITDDIWQKLKAQPAQTAFKQALGEAIYSYSTSGSRSSLAQPLFDEDGPLTKPQVVKELAKVVQFDESPNVKLIGEVWRTALVDPPHWRDFTKESQLLLDYFHDKLRTTDAFAPVFDAKSLDSIAENTKLSAEQLSQIEMKLTALGSIADTRFGDVIAKFSKVSPTLEKQIYDYTLYIEEKTLGFVGRQWIFDAIDNFIATNRRGYFFIIGDPGIGKSAIAAQIVKQNGYIHHFNIRAEGINRTADLMKNICAQLIVLYDLDYESVPPDAAKDTVFLNKLLSDVSDKVEPHEHCTIVIDALDEVDRRDKLFLPLIVPDSIYFVITMRKDDEDKIMPRTDCESEQLYIYHDASNNLQDIRDYIQASTVRSGIQAYIKTQGLSVQTFVNMMVNEKSEGNFMYLHYVLPEIEHGSYKDCKLATIPVGLKQYYEDHWQRMKGMDEDAWFRYKLPVIVALTVALEPISVDMIRDFSKINQKVRVRSVLNDWSPFLHEESVAYNNNIQKRYRLYHASFFDFVSRKEEVEDERVDLKEMHTQIVETLLGNSFSEIENSEIENISI